MFRKSTVLTIFLIVLLLNIKVVAIVNNIPRILIELSRIVKEDPVLKKELESSIKLANWTPYNFKKPISNFDDFLRYLNDLLNTTPTADTFNNYFHGLYYIVSQNDNALQCNERYKNFQNWTACFADHYGSIMNTPRSANDLYSFMQDQTYSIEVFESPPGGYNNFNSFFSRHIRPGKRPIGAKTYPYKPPRYGYPLEPNPEEDQEIIYRNMCDDTIITVPADSVYKGSWNIKKNSTVTVSKGNTYSLKKLLKGSKYADRFNNGIITHSYLSVFTYHRYHVPVRGKILETLEISSNVYANTINDNKGNLAATDEIGYQFKQDRGIVIIDSPVGLVALVPVGMDFISSCNLTVDVGDYVNKGDEFGYFLFGGSDIIMIFEKNITILLPKENMLYKVGQVFGKKKDNK
jgi:phosphatidylserine decarboxylase